MLSLKVFAAHVDTKECCLLWAENIDVIDKVEQ
jgi:hypothetical protein